MCFDLAHPVLQGIKRTPVINGIDHDYSHRAFIVGLSDGFKSFLASSVPDLQPDFFAINLDCFDLEINADGGEVRCHEVVFAKTKENVCFAYSTISDY